MSRTAARRFHISLLLVVSLLFSQLALAGYLCPSAGEAAQAVMEMAPGEPCEGMATADDQSVLCFQHCTDAPQSFEGVKLFSLPLPAVVQVVLVPLTIDTAAQQAAIAADAGQAHPPPEPVFLSTLRLRV
jgi:hypothetical protein